MSSDSYSANVFHVSPGDRFRFKFKVNKLGEGVASEVGLHSNVGGIIVQFFNACEPNGKLRNKTAGECDRRLKGRKHAGGLRFKAGRRRHETHIDHFHTIHKNTRVNPLHDAQASG